MSGTVVDSATSTPLGNALVIMTGLGSIDTTGNTVRTANNGTFSKRVIVSNSSTLRVLLYTVSKTGYNANGGQATITSKTLNLGTIKLKLIPITSTSVTKQLAIQQRIDNIQVYSLRGQLLYAGPVVATEKILQAQHTPVIVNFRCIDRTVNSVKFVPAK